MPESPRWLLRKNRPEEALASIERVKSVPHGSEHLFIFDMKDCFSDSTAGSASLVNCSQR